MDYLPGNTPGVVKSTYGGRGKAPVTHSVSRPRALGPETSPWFWNPYRCEVRFAPDDFRKRLKELHPDTEITWNPINERWQVWARSPKLQTPHCSGWRLLFINWDMDHAYMPLDERVFARLYQVDQTVNGGRAYMDRIVAEFERDQVKKRKDLQQDAIDRAMPYWEHSQIKNIGKGNKFATYLA